MDECRPLPAATTCARPYAATVEALAFTGTASGFTSSAPTPSKTTPSTLLMISKRPGGASAGAALGHPPPAAAAAASPSPECAVTGAEPGSSQGLTLVHFSAYREHF